MNIIIYGAGGMAKLVLDCLHKNGKYKIAGFLDSNKDLQGKKFFGHTCFGGIREIVKLKTKLKIKGFIVAIGDNGERAKIRKQLVGAGLEPVTLIHRKAIICRDVKVGRGSIVCAGSVIGPFAEIGENVIINIGVVVGHSSRIEDNSNLAVGVRLAGRNTVKENVYIEAGTILKGGEVAD